jgi:pimeloyl-ACP methyl ester carboxylesterase
VPHEDASEQVEAVVRFILDWHSVPSLSMISHSWGSMPMARFAAGHPTMVERLVLFGAIAPPCAAQIREAAYRAPRGASLRSKINGRALSKTFRRMNRPCCACAF